MILVQTLKTGEQFERVRREGRTWASALVVLNAAPSDYAGTRCGFIAGKKVGGAVQRNRARRLIKEAVRRSLAAVKPGWDLVWIARAPIVEANGNDVARAVDDLLARARLFVVVEKRPAAQSVPDPRDSLESHGVERSMLTPQSGRE